MSKELNYKALFDSLKNFLIARKPETTSQTTKDIKSFFKGIFDSDHTVLCSHADSNEYLVDILVLNFSPKSVISPKTLSLLPTSINAYLAVESELGGSGASSPYGVMKNTVEDYIKLLLIRCDHRVMIFTSLAYSGEVSHVANRVEVLRELYKRTPDLTSGVLLVHLQGGQPKSKQVQISIGADMISGFIISKNWLSVEKIENSALADKSTAYFGTS